MAEIIHKINQKQNTNSEDVGLQQKRNVIAEKLAAGELENEMITIEVEEQQSSMFDMLQGSGMEQMGMNMQDALGGLMPKKTKKT